MQSSFLDRLLGADPKTSFRRDLSALLNSRLQTHEIDPAFEQAAASVLTFGLPDFTSYNLNSSIDRERVRCSIERAIRQFEPRLTRIVVSLEQLKPLDPVLTLRIEGELREGDTTSTISLDALLDRASRRILVQGSA